MNLRDLMTKLDTIAEAGATITNPYKTPEDRAKFDSLSPEDQEWYSRPVSDDKGGMRPATPDLTDPYIAARAPNKGKSVAKPPAATPTPVANPGTDPTDAQMIELDKLRDQLLATLGGGAAAPVTTTNPVAPPVDQPEKEKTLGQKAGIGAGIAAGAMGGAALGKKYGGTKGAVLGGLTGGALGGMGINAFQKESVELSMAQSLTESFGYDFEDEQLDEYSMDQFGKDAGDFGRGAWNGVTLGTGDNIAAGVQSAFGKDTYKQALAKQTAASKEAETRSPWLYGAGNVAGSIAAPIPGGAIAGGVMRGAKALGAGAKLATGVGMAGSLGANMLAQQGVDMVKQASDTKTLGYDPSKYPTTPQAIMAFQTANGLTADGKIGPKTQAMLAKMGLKPEAATTVAEDIKSLKDKLAMIESGWQDYHVWLLEDNTVVGEDGTRIVDESFLSAIEWDQARLDELSLSGLGTSLGRGYDAVANVGRNFVGGLAGKDATGNLIKNTEKNFAGRMAAPKANGKIRSAAEIARDSTNARGTANMANKAANYVGKNPGKVALGAAALGAGGVAAANALGGGASASPAGTTTGGGASSGAQPATTTPATTTPVGSGELTPEQKEIIAKMQKIIQGVGATEDEGLLGHIAPATAAIQKATQSATSGQSASPAGTTTATQQAVPGVKAGGQVVDTRGGIAGKDEMEESVDELTRWLRIARG